MPDKDKLKKLRKEADVLYKDVLCKEVDVLHKKANELEKEVDVLYKKAKELDKIAMKAWNAYEKTNDKFQDLKAKLLEDDYGRP